MGRLLACLVVLAAAAALPLAASAGPAAKRSARAPAAVKVTDCIRVPGARSAEFRAVMRRVPRTRRMAMRFVIQERVGRGRYLRVDAPGLGVWRKSRAGVERFAYRQEVLALGEGARYRTVVSFRWYDRRGRRIRSARRVSGACAQPGRLPNLTVRRIRGRPLGERRLVRYIVTVANRGDDGSGATALSLSVDGATVDTVPVPALDPRSRTKVFVTGPRCRSGVRADVDPDDDVRERRERDNDRSVACP